MNLLWVATTEDLPVMFDDGYRMISEYVLVEDIYGDYWTAYLQSNIDESLEGDAEPTSYRWIQFGRDGYSYELEHIKHWASIP